MTYTKHRSTQETLQTLDSLELDNFRTSHDDLIKKFNWQNDSHLASTGQLPIFKRAQMIIWQLFEEPRSSSMSRVSSILKRTHSLSTLFILIIQGLVIDIHHLYRSIDHHVCSSNINHISSNGI